MASGFPGSIDNFTDPLSNSSLSSPSHAGQHADLNDAVEKIETYMGLVRIVAAGSFSAAATVNVDSIFSANYDLYRIVWVETDSTSAAETRIQFRTSGATNTTSNYTHQNSFFTTATTSVRNTVATTYSLLTQNVGANGWSFEINLANPYSNTRVTTGWMSGTVDTGSLFFNGSLAFGATTRFDGVSIFRSSGTMTGQYYVYGYRN